MAATRDNAIEGLSVLGDKTALFLSLNGGLMKICDDFWKGEFMRWAVPMLRVKPDADIYDVFCWIREQQQGSTPYSESFLAKIDLDIEKEIAREQNAA